MIALNDVTITQGNFLLRNLNLHVETGSYVALTGASGSGKTTILEVIAGLRFPNAGTVTIHGTTVTFLPPQWRGIGYVPQDGAPFQSMTVAENLSFALRVQGQSQIATRSRVDELANWLGLVPLLSRKAKGLSGGETQRLALGRALAHKPKVLLMDEPLSAQDDDTRARLITLLKELRDARTTTIINVSHNRADFAHLADKEYKIVDHVLQEYTE